MDDNDQEIIIMDRKKLTLEEFINRSNKIHNYKYSYEKSIYKNNKEKIIITCKYHGDFDQVPKSHLNGSGCLKCSGIEKLNFILKKKYINHEK